MLRLETLGEVLESPLTDPGQALEVLTNALTKGQHHADLWELLHRAAQRDEKLAELAFAYEHALNDKRVKLMSPASQAELFMQAARFFGDLFNDADGAVNYAERALAAVPGHSEAFALMERLLAGRRDHARLARLYVDAAATERDRDRHLELLRRAARQLEGVSGVDDLAIDIHQRIVRIDPADGAALAALEARFAAAGRHRDAARLLEQALAKFTGETSESLAVRSKLLDLYTGELGEPPRAIGHVEVLLGADPGNARALSVAEALLEHRVVAPKAAAALSEAYEKLGRTEHAAAMLTRELKLATGQRKALVQKRLAILKQDALGDPVGALELLAPAVALDPGDDDLRRRYVKLSVALDQPLEAAKRLSRALQSIKDPAVKARVGVEIGNVYLTCGDVKRGLEALDSVLAVGADDGAVLAAAQKLADLHAEAGDQKKLAQALELVVRLEARPDARSKAARRLARLCEEIGETAKAITAYRALVESEWADEALARLQALYEEAADHEELAEVLERRSARSQTETEARELAFRAAELRSTKLRDRGQALRAWHSFLERFGPSREAHARLIPLLEHEKQWEQVARLIEAELALAPAEEQAALLGKLGHIRLARLNDVSRALAAFGNALGSDPKDRVSRGALEKLLSTGPARLEAADVLEPIYRHEQSKKELVRTLELRGELAVTPDVRLSALDEAVELAGRELGDAEHALVIAGRALAEAVAHQRDAVPRWLERTQSLAAAAGNPVTRAQVLAAALGERTVDSDELLALARGAAEALAASGDIGAAVAMYRRALEYAPGSADLVRRIDELLTEQGSPAERVALYSSALEQPCDAARRRELLHAMARVQRLELGDARGAAASFHAALEEDPRDATAHQALLEICAEQGDFSAVSAELTRALEFAQGERRHELLERMAEVQAEHGDPAVALAHYRTLLGEAELSDAKLEMIEQLAERQGEPRMVCEVLLRRVGASAEQEERADLLERLGRVQALELDDADGAARSWLEAARLSEGDEERALRLYERVLHVASGHLEAAERLVELYAKSGAWERVPAVFEVLLRLSRDGREPVSRLLGLEEQAVRAGAVGVFVTLLNSALKLEDLDRARAAQLARTKAHVLSHDPSQHDEVSGIYQQLLTAGEGDVLDAAAEFERFLDATSPSPRRIEDRRWLFNWRAEHASDPSTILLGWARAEEEAFGNPAGAAQLYQRVLERDPLRTDALNELARLQAAQGDAPAALATLRVLREHTTGEVAAALDRQIAWLLVERLGKVDQALDVAANLLEGAPGDADALQIVHRALGVSELRARAAALLERASESADDPRARAGVLEALLAIPVDGPELSDARRGWFERLLECKVDDPEAAMEIALRGAQEHPESEALWSAAERLARRLDRPAPVADAFAGALERDLTPELAEELGRRMVEFHEEWFEEPDRVVALLKRVLALSPAAGWAFDRLKLAFNASARWAELFELYDQALAREAPAQERGELLREAAMAAKDFAADARRAIAYLEQLNAVYPDDASIESSLERLYERQGERRPLIQLLERRLGRVESGERYALRLRIAALWLDVDEPLPAFELLRNILDESPHAAEPYALLERLVALPSSRDRTLTEVAAGAKRAPSIRELAASVLREHYEETGKLDDAARMMEVLLDSATGKKERVRRLEEIVRLRLERLGDARGALANVAKLVELDPRREQHRELLASLAEQTGEERQRADLLVKVAREQDELAVRAGLLREAAEAHVGPLHDPETAIALHLEVLELAGDHATLALAAARDLDPLLEAAGRHAEHCGVLERRAALERDRDARRLALSRAANVAATALGDFDRAIRNWRGRLADDPRDQEALDGLVAVLSRTDRHAELIAALGARANLSGDPEHVRADLVRIAQLHAERLGDRPAAIEAWHVVRERSGRDPESFEALLPLLEAEGRWSELAALLAEEATNQFDAESRALLYRRLGAVHRTKTGDLMRALQAFVAAGDWDEAIATARSDTAPKEVTLRVCHELLDQAITHWSSHGEAPGGAAQAAAWAIGELGERLRAAGNHEAVVTLLLRGAALPFERRRQRELRRDAACVCSDHLQDSERAIDLFRSIFTEDPSDPVATSSVTRLALLLEERGAHGEIAELWEQQARARLESGDRSAAAALWLRAAEIWETRLHEVDRAIADYRQGAGLGGELALEALARIHEARGESRRVAECLEWLCAQSSREALAARALRLANAYEAIGERRFARARLERAAGVALDAGAVRRRLAELYRDDRDWGPLAELLTTEAARTPDARARLGLLREAATLHIEKRRQPNDAVPLLEQAVELEPDEPAVRLELSSALERAGRFEDAAVILKRQIERYGSRRPKDRALVHFQLARVSLAAGRRAEAITELGVATKIDPAHPGILQALARLAFEEGQYDRAERMYRALLLVLKPSDEQDAPSRAEALLDLSDIALTREEPVRAAEFVESAFEAALDSLREAVRLEQALKLRNRHELLARAIEARLERATRPEEAARALADLVMLHADELAAREARSETVREQAEAIQAALERERVADDGAWSALGAVYDWLGDEGAEVRILERRVATFAQSDHAPPDATPFYRLAEVRVADPRTRAEAVTLLERAFAMQPDVERAERLLRQALREDPGDERAIGLLEGVARGANRQRALCEALLARLALPEPDPAKVRELLVTARGLGEPELQEQALRASLALPLPDSDAAGVRRELADLLASRGELAEALVLRQELAGFLPGEDARRLLVEVASVAAKQVGDLDLAERIYKGLLETEPADSEAWGPLLELYRKRGAKTQLVQLLEQTAPLVESIADRARLRFEQANIQLESGDADGAAETLKEILVEDPTQQAAGQLLSEILEGAGRVDELLHLLGLQLDAAKDRQDTSSITSIAMRMGGFLEDAGRLPDALEVYRAALDWDAGFRPALESVVRLADLQQDPLALGDAVEGLLRVSSGQPAVTLAARLVQLRVEQRDAAGAERALELGFNACPGNAELRDGLLARYRKRQDWAGVATVLQRSLESSPKEAELVGQLIEAYRAGGEPERALQVLEGVIASDPESATLLRQRALLLQELGRHGEALGDLERAHATSGAYAAELVQALERAAAEDEPSTHRDRVLRLVEIQDELGDVEGARNRLNELIKADAKDRDALYRLASLELRSESWAGASTVYRRLIALEEGEALVEVALKLADACERAERFADARGGLERALKVAPHHAELRDRLRRLYEVTGESRELARMLEEDAASETEVGVALEHLLRAGALLLAPDGDVNEAARVLLDARRLSPESLDAVVLLAQAFGARGQREEALRLLEESALANRGKRTRALSDVYREMARQQLEDGMLSDALDALQKAFDLDLRNSELAMQLGELALEMEEWETAARAFRSVTMMRPVNPETGEGATVDAKADSHFYLAWLSAKAGDTRKARLFVNKALTERPDHERARALLEELGSR